MNRLTQKQLEDFQVKYVKDMHALMERLNKIEVEIGNINDVILNE